MPQTSQACDRVQELLLPPNLRESAARTITQRGLVLHVVTPFALRFFARVRGSVPVRGSAPEAWSTGDRAHDERPRGRQPESAR
jgi:hypothetical protein